MHYYFKYLLSADKFPRRKYTRDIQDFYRREIQKYGDEMRILDAGCGVGTIIKALGDDLLIYGADIQFDAIFYCKSHFENAEFLISNLGKIPFKNESFDLIVCSMVIEHIHGQGDFLKELGRILKKSGSILITTPNYKSLLWRIVENVWYRFFVRSFKPYRREVHPNRFTPEKLEGILLASFHNVEIDTITLGMTVTAIASWRD